MTDSHDEISLRELYLILRRGLPLIVGVALLAGLLAFAVTSLMPDRYQAETTVLINPTPVRVQGGSSLALDQRNDVSFETYRSIAFSRPVLEDALSRLGEVDLAVGELRSSGSLERLVGPQRPDQVAQLTISHLVVHSDPALAAAASDAWAAATVDTVRRTLLATLNPIRETTVRQIEMLEERLSELESSWEAFQSRDESALLEAQLTGIAERIALTEGTLEERERDIAAAQARIEVLERAAVRSAPEAGPPAGGEGVEAGESAAAPDGVDPQAAVELLRSREDLAPGEAAELAALLRADPEGADGDLVSLMGRLELQRQRVDLAGLTAQRDTLRQQLDEFRRQAQSLRERQAGLALERDRLRRELERVQSAHSDVAALEPVLSYINELAPTSSRILNDASVPSDPVGPRRLLVSVLATVAMGFAALLFVFLRAAVAEPRPAGDPVTESQRRATAR